MPLKKIYLVEDPLTPATWTEHDHEDVRAFCTERFPEWPKSARIYHKSVADSCDVTPRDIGGVEKLGELEGPFWIVVYPGEMVLFVNFVIGFFAVAAVQFFRGYNVPEMAAQKPKSSNNSLADRSNRERINARIPDIFGTVRSIPDLLSVPYKIFDRHEEVEYALMCIGRGAYNVTDIKDGDTLVRNIRGATVEVYPPFTPLYGAFTMTLNVFGSQFSFTFPVPGSPEIRIGNPIYEPLLFPKRINSINGQTMRPPSDKPYTGLMKFKSPNVIEIQDENQDLTERYESGDPLTITGTAQPVMSSGTYTGRFQANGTILFQTGTSLDGLNVGDSITLAGASYRAGIETVSLNGTYNIIAKGTNSIRLQVGGFGGGWYNIQNYYFRENGYATGYDTFTITKATGEYTLNLDGTYQILAVDATTILLDDPASINAGWNVLSQLENSSTAAMNATIAANGPRYVGPYGVFFPNFRHLYANFVAMNGLYSIDENGNHYDLDVQIVLEVTRVDADDNAIGAPEEFRVVLEGSKTKKQRAVTLRCSPSWATGEHDGRCRIRAWRETGEFVSNDGKDTFVENIQFRDLYALCQFPANTNLGDITVVRTQTRGTLGALVLKELKTNMLVQRKLDVARDGVLVGTNRVDDIITAMCLDPYIGGRSLAEVDIVGMKAVIDDVINYFTQKNAQATMVGDFNYTFDDTDISFEESVAVVANAAFCIAFRRGNVIHLKFEKPSPDSVLLFNHRNKLPGTEIRTVRFGIKDGHDGVEFEYTSPLDDSKSVFYIPEDRSAVNPARHEGIGIRSRIHAYYHAYRIWNKMKYQNVSVEFEATQEADLLVQMDRILVADNTRADTVDGDILEQNGLELTLSRNVELP